MGKSKKRSKEYSSDSVESSDSEEELVKSKKHKKSSKKAKKHKSKKKRRSSSSSSESGAWVEKEAKKSPSLPPKAETKQREDWMSNADNFFLPTFSKEKQPTKTAAEKAKLDVYDPATSSRELNPYFKTGEGGMPSFQRPKENDEDDYYGRRGPAKSFGSAGNWRKSRPDEGRRDDNRRDKTRRDEQRRDDTRRDENRREDSNRSENQKDDNCRDDIRRDEPRRHREETRRERSQSQSRYESKSPSRSPTPEKPERVMLPAKPPQIEEAAGETASHSDFLTDEQMNEIGAKMIRAELLGNEKLAEKLKVKLDKAKAFKSSGKAAPVRSRDKEQVVLSITNAAGVTRPAQQESDRRPQDKKKKNKRVETHVAGERTCYYPDDGKYDIKQMFEREKFTDGRDQDIEFAKAISKVKDSQQMDMADIFSDTIRKDKQSKSDERDEAIREHKKMEKVLDSCNKCFDSPKMDKDLIIHVFKKIYLSIPYYEGLVNHHLVISPIQHVPCSTNVDEDIWEEVLNLKKALTKFFLDRKEDVVFFEIVKFLNRRPHMEIHCVASLELEMIQFYFKKAIQECEKSTLNKKLIELKGEKNIRRSVPKNLPYFWVDFGSTGMAHVIEDQEEFPWQFAQEVIGGMMNLDVNKWRKPRKEQQPKKRTSYFNSLLKNVLQSL